MDTFMQRNLACIVPPEKQFSPCPILAVKFSFIPNGPSGFFPGPVWIVPFAATAQTTVSAQKMERKFMQERNYFPAL